MKFPSALDCTWDFSFHFISSRLVSFPLRVWRFPTGTCMADSARYARKATKAQRVNGESKVVHWSAPLKRSIVTFVRRRICATEWAGGDGHPGGFTPDILGQADLTSGKLSRVSTVTTREHMGHTGRKSFKPGKGWVLIHY